MSVAFLVGIPLSSRLAVKSSPKLVGDTIAALELKCKLFSGIPRKVLAKPL